MNAIIVTLALVLLLCVAILVVAQDFSPGDLQKRRELRRLIKQQDARKAWERMIKADW